MNKTNFKQYDTRWASLGYPKKPYYIRNCGCGEVSIANIIIEMEKYKSQTPKTIQPYCVQYAAPNGNGTYFSGIPKMMEHYGLTEVKEHQTMQSLWDELKKGNRVCILLMGNRKGGSKGIHWTSSAHFIAGVAYRCDGKTHELYIKDSNSASSSRNGWLSYEGYLRNDVSRVWSGALPTDKPYYPSTPYTGTLPSSTVKKGSKGTSVKAVQTFLNWCIGTKLAVDGDCGTNTDSAIRKYQKQYSLAVDGIFGSASKKKAQQIIAKYAPTDTLTAKILAACKTQAEWMKNYVYGWQKDPTIEKSKKKGTCVTYVACVLQRLGYLKPGEHIWQNGKGYGTGKVYGTNSKMTVTYMKNKTLASLKSKLKAGDIVMVDDNKSGKSGSGGHIFILSGKWNGNNPLIWDNSSGLYIKKGKDGAHSYSGTHKVLAIVRLK